MIIQPRSGAHTYEDYMGEGHRRNRDDDRITLAWPCTRTHKCKSLTHPGWCRCIWMSRFRVKACLGEGFCFVFLSFLDASFVPCFLIHNGHCPRRRFNLWRCSFHQLKTRTRACIVIHACRWGIKHMSICYFRIFVSVLCATASVTCSKIVKGCCIWRIWEFLIIQGFLSELGKMQSNYKL